ncbi:MAG: flagellar basal body L-ring protein FlgH [Pseudomonadota bacterium]
MSVFRLLICFCLILSLSGCARLMNIGKFPEMTPGLTQINQAKRPDVRKLNIPYDPQIHNRNGNYNSRQGYYRDYHTASGKPNAQMASYIPQRNHSSLWHSGPESLFGDRRARNIGDLLTVNIEIDDRAEVNNRTERSRDATEESSITAGFGIDRLIDKNLPSPLSVTPGLNASGIQQTNGEGRINRLERIELKIAAMVVDILPNGNFVIQGSQEVNVNYELRDLQISGIVRPHDISRKNTIGYDKIAEARIYYGGRGNVTELQQPRYGSQFFDVIAPF